jgi:hypothetical protein
MNAQRPPVLYVTSEKKFVDELDSLAKTLKISKARLLRDLIYGGLDWLVDPDPLADPPHELRKLRSRLHGVSTERVQSPARGEPASPALSEQMMRAYEMALSAKDQTIRLLEQEIARMREGVR